MPDLINTFSWSFSAASDFEECRRRRYWAKYAMWGGWKDDASPIQKAAYRLTKMQTAFTMLGTAVEIAVMHAIRRHQAGEDLDAETLYQMAARPFLNKAWKESLNGQWRENPRKFYCLREHYYRELNGNGNNSLTQYIIDQTKLCMVNFVGSVLPRLAKVTREQEVPVNTVAMGDPESFDLDGIKVYAIPDYVWREGDILHIHDWKAGKIRPDHHDQMALYALWANLKKNTPPENVRLHIEYLSANKVEDVSVTKAMLEEVVKGIKDSVADMSEYLVDNDIRRNEPQPKEEWDLAEAREICKQCNFYELCKPELDHELG